MTISDIFDGGVISGIFWSGLAVGLMISLCASLLGVSLVLKKYSMIGDGLSHVGFGTMAVATAIGALTGNTGTSIESASSRDFSLLISVPIVVITAVLLLRVSENSRIKGDAAVALVSTGAVAVGVIVYNISTGMTADVCGSMFGSASVFTAGVGEIVMSVMLCAAVLALFVLFYNRMFSVTFDEAFAAATGTRITVYKNLLAILTALTIVLGMRMMGTILISGIIIFPALTAMRVCGTFKRVCIVSAVVSVVCFVIGYVIACLFEMQTGPCVIVVNIIAFLAFSAVGRVRSR